MLLSWLWPVLHETLLKTLLMENHIGNCSENAATLHKRALSEVGITTVQVGGPLKLQEKNSAL
jgi:hypothetical protein